MKPCKNQMERRRAKKRSFFRSNFTLEAQPKSAIHANSKSRAWSLLIVNGLWLLVAVRRLRPGLAIRVVPQCTSGQLHKTACPASRTAPKRSTQVRLTTRGCVLPARCCELLAGSALGLCTACLGSTQRTNYTNWPRLACVIVHYLGTQCTDAPSLHVVMCAA